MKSHYELVSSNFEPTAGTHPNDIVIQLAYSNYHLREIAAHIKSQVGIENSTIEDESHRFLVIREKVHLFMNKLLWLCRDRNSRSSGDLGVKFLSI